MDDRRPDIGLDAAEVSLNLADATGSLTLADHPLQTRPHPDCGGLNEPSQPNTLSELFGKAARDGNVWAQKLKDSYYLCCRHAWETELDKRPALSGSSLEQWLDFAMPVIASIPKPILYEIVAGNISRAANTADSEVRKLLLKYRSSCSFNGEGRPGIYVITLVDARGRAPTPSDLTRIARELEDKSTQKQQIDNDTKQLRRSNATKWAASSYVGKGRKFLDTKSKPASDGVSEKVSQFTMKLLQNMADNENQEIPLEHPLQYFGYAKDMKTRMKSHLEHSGSSFIMSLTESIALNLWISGQVSREYMLQEFPICFLAQPEEAIAAEVLLSCIGDGYIQSGWGFAHVGAGQSNHSVNDYNRKQWSDLSTWVVKHTPREENLSEEKVRLREKNRLFLQVRTQEESIALRPQREKDLAESLQQLYANIKELEDLAESQIRERVKDAKAKAKAFADEFPLDVSSYSSEDE